MSVSNTTTRHHLIPIESFFQQYEQSVLTATAQYGMLNPRLVGVSEHRNQLRNARIKSLRSTDLWYYRC